MTKSSREYKRIDDKFVYIVDMDFGGKSVTNDAEAVCAEIAKEYPNHRIIYRDSDCEWSEMVHNKGQFILFAEYEAWVT